MKSKLESSKASEVYKDINPQETSVMDRGKGWMIDSLIYFMIYTYTHCEILAEKQLLYLKSISEN